MTWHGCAGTPLGTIAQQLAMFWQLWAMIPPMHNNHCVGAVQRSSPTIKPL